jgi:hypothetical protein
MSKQRVTFVTTVERDPGAQARNDASEMQMTWIALRART